MTYRSGAVKPVSIAHAGGGLTIGPGSTATSTVFCDAGDVVTGGGFGSTSPTVIVVDEGITFGATQGWHVTATNTDNTGTHNIGAEAMCLKLTP